MIRIDKDQLKKDINLLIECYKIAHLLDRMELQEIIETLEKDKAELLNKLKELLNVHVQYQIDKNGISDLLSVKEFISFIKSMEGKK